MRVRGGRQAERLLKRNLSRGRVEEVRSAHDLGHILSGIVHDDRELVRGRAVSALDDEVADRGCDVFGERAENEIFEGEDAGRNAEADGADLLSGRKAAAARPWIDASRGWITAVGGGSRPGEIRPRTGTGVDHSPFSKNLQRRVVVRETPRLKSDLLVPRQAVALERSENLVRGSRDDARRVEILHPHEPAPAVRTGEQPRAQRGDEAAKVQGSRGRGRESPGRDAHGARLTRE